MTDYASSYTNRVRLTYQSLGRVHKMLWRLSDISEGNLIVGTQEMVDFLLALTSYRFTDWTVVGWEYSVQGSDFFLPFDPGIALGPGSATVSGAYDANVFFGFQGISTLGNRASIYVYGVKHLPQTGVPGAVSDYRIYATEDPVISDALVELNGSALNVAIDNASVAWKQYANIGYNAYWQRKSRQV